MAISASLTARRTSDREYVRNAGGKQPVPEQTGVVLEFSDGQQLGVSKATFDALFPGAGYNPTDRTFDNTALTVTTVPLDQATDVAVDANVVMTFSKDIDATTVNSTNITVDVNGGAAVEGAFTVADNVVTFNPTSNLTNSDTIDVVITTDVLDVYGLALAEAHSFSFTVVAA